MFPSLGSTARASCPQAVTISPRGVRPIWRRLWNWVDESKIRTDIVLYIYRLRWLRTFSRVNLTVRWESVMPPTRDGCRCEPRYAIFYWIPQIYARKECCCFAFENDVHHGLGPFHNSCREAYMGRISVKIDHHLIESADLVLLREVLWLVCPNHFSLFTALS